MGTAAAPEDERAGGEVAALGGDLIVERWLLDHRRLGIRQREPGRLCHRFTAAPPGSRDTDEAGGELAAAAVALVSAVDRDGGQRPAIGASRAERAHRELGPVFADAWSGSPHEALSPA
jgi:hypothetical protein